LIIQTICSHKAVCWLRRSLPLLALVSGLLFWAPPPTAHSQSPPITASVNHSQYSTDELVILSVTVVNNDSPQQLRPILPPLDGLTVIDFDLATSVREVNGKIQTESIYTYQLQPRRTGTLTIPPIAVKVDDEIFETAPITFLVQQGSAPIPSPGNAGSPGNIVPPPELDGEDFFVESLVNLSTPYIGQQLIYTFRFYQAIKLYRQPQYEMPIFTGLDTVGLPVREYNLDFGGRTYLVTEIRTALFPKTDGTTLIGPARLTFPGNFFEEPVELSTKPVMLQVKPLPGNAPAGFNGAVGQYTIEAWFSPQVAVFNQPSTLKVAISGTGNIHALPEPVWPRLTGWRAYDSSSSLATDLKNDTISGTRVYERMIISDRIGDFSIPPTRLVFFDPIASTYQTISTKSLSGRIIPAPTPNPATATAVAISALPTATPVTPIKLFDASAEQPVNQSLPGSLESGLRLVFPFAVVLLWAVCGAIPAAAVVGGGVVWLWQKRPQQSAIETETLHQPAQKSHPTLMLAMATTKDNYKVVNQAITRYLEEMLQTPVKGLTQKELVHRLQQHGLPQASIGKIGDYLAESEMGRFGPKGDDEGWNLLAQTEKLLFELDQLLKP